MPAEPFDACEHATPRVDSKSLATVRQNQYSLPVRLAGLRVAARIGAREIVFITTVARSPGTSGCTAGSGPPRSWTTTSSCCSSSPARSPARSRLRQERERGAWPDCFDELWRGIQERVGASEAARQMVDVLLLCRELPAAQVELAVRGALAAGALDGRAVQVLARRAERAQPGPLTGLDDRLAARRAAGARSRRL